MENPASGERLVRTAGVVMILIFVSRILGLVREMAIAQVFGMNWQTDVFRNAFNLPDLMYFLLIAGGLNAAFIPVFTGYLAKDEEDEAWRVANVFFTMTMALLLVMTVLGIAGAPYLTPLVGYGFTGEHRILLISFMRLLFIAVFFTALAGLGMGVHKSYKSFTAPMVGPIVYNTIIILGTVILARWIGIYALVVGTIVGAAGNFLVQLPFFRKKSAGRLAFSLNWRHPGFRKMMALMGPSVLALSIFQLSFMISANIASGLAEGSASALRIGQQLIQLPLGIFAMGMGTVLLPTMSEQVAKQDFASFRVTLSIGLRTVLFITIPAAVGLAVLGVPIIRLLFQFGAFTADNTEMTAAALRYYALGLFAQATSQILMQVFFALQDTKTLVRVSLVSIAGNTGLALLLLKITPLQHGALALAWSLTAVVNMGVYWRTLSRRIGAINFRPLVMSVAKSMLAAAVTGAAAYIASEWTAGHANLATANGRLLQVGVGVVAGVAVYAATAYALRMEELNYARRLLPGQRSKKSSSN